MTTAALADLNPPGGHDRVVSRSAYVFAGPIQSERWFCETCRAQSMLDELHSRHWLFDHARYHVRCARGPRPECSITGICYGRGWHLDQARKCREYGHNVNGMIEGRPNRYAERQGVPVDRKGRR